MTTLAEFLLARIAEEEAAAREGAEDDKYDCSDRAAVPYGAWSQERVLAECERDRRIVAEHSRHPAFPRTCRTCGRPGQSIGADWPCKTLRLMAVVHAGHPDYREEWKP